MVDRVSSKAYIGDLMDKNRAELKKLGWWLLDQSIKLLIYGARRLASVIGRLPVQNRSDDILVYLCPLLRTHLCPDELVHEIKCFDVQNR